MAFLGFETLGFNTTGIRSDSIPSILWPCTGPASSLAAMVPKVVEGIPAQIVDGQIAEMAEEQDDIQPDEATTLPVCPTPLCRGV